MHTSERTIILARLSRLQESARLLPPHLLPLNLVLIQQLETAKRELASADLLTMHAFLSVAEQRMATLEWLVRT